MFCSNCGAEVNSSDKFCNNCGRKIENPNIKDVVESSTELPAEVDFFQDIGGRAWNAKNLTTNYKGGSCIDVKEGPTAIVFHKNGLKIHSGVFKKFEVPYSNIITVQYEDRDSLGNYRTKDKSVVGRAVAGGLLLGPLGAVIGGMSGIGTKSKKLDQETDYLIINYWDKSTKSNEVLLFSGKNRRSEFNNFVNDFLKWKRQSQNFTPKNSIQSSVSQEDIDFPQSNKSQTIALVLSIFLGGLGLDRFYLGHFGLGFLKFITFGGFGIWWLIDIILIASKNMKDSNGLPLKFT
ncbi:MAG: NINE protein [Balneola sp.]